MLRLLLLVLLQVLLLLLVLLRHLLRLLLMPLLDLLHSWITRLLPFHPLVVLFLLLLQSRVILLLLLVQLFLLLLVLPVPVLVSRVRRRRPLVSRQFVGVDRMIRLPAGISRLWRPVVVSALFGGHSFDCGKGSFSAFRLFLLPFPIPVDKSSRIS